MSSWSNPHSRRTIRDTGTPYANPCQLAGPAPQHWYRPRGCRIEPPGRPRPPADAARVGIELRIVSPEPSIDCEGDVGGPEGRGAACRDVHDRLSRSLDNTRE